MHGVQRLHFNHFINARRAFRFHSMADATILGWALHMLPFLIGWTSWPASTPCQRLQSSKQRSTRRSRKVFQAPCWREWQDQARAESVHCGLRCCAIFEPCRDRSSIYHKCVFMTTKSPTYHLGQSQGTLLTFDQPKESTCSHRAEISLHFFNVCMTVGVPHGALVRMQKKNMWLSTE